MKKYITTIGIVGLIAVALLTSVLVWGFNQKPIDQSKKVDEEIDTSDWQTYRNEEYGFEFKYPGEWYYEILSDGRFGLYPPGKSRGYEYVGDIIVNPYKNDKNLTIPQYQPSESYKNQIINDHYIYYLKDWPGMIESDLYFLKLDDMIFELTVFNDNNEVAKGIISTINTDL